MTQAEPTKEGNSPSPADKKKRKTKTDTLMRMVKAYAKNKSIIDKKTDNNEPLTQKQKRLLKVADLVARSGQSGEISWKGLE